MNLAFIPARKGSQGVPGKNTKELLGKPLIQWSIEQAQDARGVDEVWVSSDDPEVLAIARDCGAEPLLRPEEISGATAQIEEAITYHLEIDERRLSIDYILLLQPTSPNRTSIDIERALGHIRETDADSLVSMVATHSPFYWTRDRDLSWIKPYDERPRRQDIPEVFQENGNIYIFKRQGFRGDRVYGKTVSYCMEPDTAHEIDTPLDWLIMEQIMKERHGDPVYRGDRTESQR